MVVRPLWGLYVLLLLVYIVGTSVFLVRQQKTGGGLHFFPVKSFIIPFLAGTIGEILLPAMSLTTVGSSLGFLMIYFGILNENTYEDPLTGFYNAFFLERISREAALGDYDFSSGILFFTPDLGDYMSEHGLLDTDRLLKRIAKTLREELPEGCETMYLGDGRFLSITRVGEEQEEAIKMVIEVVADALTEEAGEQLRFLGCYALRDGDQDPGSLLSKLMEIAVETDE